MARHYNSYLVKEQGLLYELLKEKPTVVDTIPAGVYETWETPWDELFIKPLEMSTDELLPLNGTIVEDITKEVSNFLKEDTKQKFKKNKLLYRRSILLHGKPGVGKTAAIKLAIKDLQARDSIILMQPSPHDLKSVLKAIRSIEGQDRLISIVWEDVEQYFQWYENLMLAIMDGQWQIDNVFYIATTNNIDEIPARFKNRPSRFARVIEVPLPDANTRKIFLDNKLNQEDKWMTELLVQVSAGLSIDQLKELIVNVVVYDMDPEEAVKIIKA